MIGSAKLYIYGVLAIFLFSAAGGAYWYYSWSQDEIKTLRDNNSRLGTAVTLQKATISTMEKDAVRSGRQVLLVSKQFRNARSENNALRTKLAKHDLAYLAENKPGLITKIVNKGTSDVGRCFEILSGSELTAKELTATKKSQTNSSCPNIANPNYKPKL